MNLSERIKSWMNDRWLRLAQLDIEDMENELADLPRREKLAVLEAERRHSEMMIALRRGAQRRELELQARIALAKHDLNVMAEAMSC